LIKFVHPCTSVDPAEVREVNEELSGRHRVIHGEITREITGPPSDLNRVLDDVEAEHGSGSPGGKEEVQQQADGGRFTCAVGSDEAVNLSLLDIEIEVDDARRVAVVLR
jgi:hypothetical protein